MSQKNRRLATVACVVLLALGFIVILFHVEHAVRLHRVQGSWEGTMRFHAGQNMRKQRIVIRVFKDKDGSYLAALDQIDLGVTNLSPTRFAAGWSSVVFESKSNFVFSGKLNASATEIIGRWNWWGAKRSQPLSLNRTLTPDVVQPPLPPADYTPRGGSDLQGLWQGALKINAILSLRLQFKIAESEDGKYRGELNSIDQPPVIPIPATVVDYRKPRVTISFQGIGGVFDGTLNNNGAEISGTWTQATSWPLTLTRIDSAAGTTVVQAAKQ